MIKRMLLCAFAVLWLFSGSAWAQQAVRYQPASEGNMAAEDLLTQHFYGLAMKNALNVDRARLPALYDGVNAEPTRSQFIRVICGLKEAAPFAVDSALELLPS